MSGGVTGAILATRQLFADSTTFRTLTGAANQAAALAKIFQGRASDTDAAQAPPRLIVIPLPLSFRTDDWNKFVLESPEILISLDHKPSSPATYTDASFFATIESLNSEIMALMNQPGRLVVPRFQLFLTGQVPPEENNGEQWWRADWILQLGGLP